MMSDADKARQILNNVAYVQTDLEDMRLLKKFLDGRTGDEGWRILDTAALDENCLPIPARVMAAFRDALQETIDSVEAQTLELESRIRVVDRP